MTIESEKEAKLVVQACIATAMICTDHPVLGLLALAIMLPWAVIGRVAAWLAKPVVEWRTKKKVPANAVPA
jgi:hypothetical protein